jgi:hypothetical protein
MGFQLGFWDYATFATIIIIGAGFGGLVILILGLPGKIAIARKHPEAEAVNLMGWVGFLGVVPWIQALIWAFKPTDVVDIRRFPRRGAGGHRRGHYATQRQVCIGSIAGAGRGEKTSDGKKEKE